MKTIRETILSPSFYILTLMAAGLGALAGIVTILFIRCFEAIQHVLWDKLPATLGLGNRYPFYTLLICTIGGLLVGLCIKYLGSYPKSIEESLEDFKKTKHFDYKHVPHAFVTSMVSLGFGAALGPEAALTTIIGGISTWINKRIKQSVSNIDELQYASVAGVLGALFGSPIGAAALPLSEEDKHTKHLPRLRALIPAIAAAIAGLLVFKALNSDSGYFDFNLLAYSFSPIDLVKFIAPALAGAIMGLLFVWSHGFFTRLVKPIQKNTVLLAVVGGLLLGALAMITPLALFSGHEGIQTLIYDYGTTSALVFIGFALVKVLAASSGLATGWKGGQFFPVMFIGAAAGLGMSYLIGSINPTLGLATGLSAALAAVLKKPVAAAILAMFFFPPNLYVTVALAALLGGFCSQRLNYKNEH